MALNSSIQWHTFEQLERWLQARGIDVSYWGLGQAKSAKALWTEVSEGETCLLDSPVRRVVETVVVIIRRGKEVLVEREEQLPDGRLRKRNWPPSEKLKQGETYLQAAVRGLAEELHIPSERVQFALHNYRLVEEERESVSYPNLPALYRIHIVEAAIEGIPHGRFFTEEWLGDRPRLTKKHYWEWVEPFGKLSQLINFV